jgi:hypothetical protein
MQNCISYTKYSWEISGIRWNGWCNLFGLTLALLWTIHEMGNIENHFLNRFGLVQHWYCDSGKYAKGQTANPFNKSHLHISPRICVVAPTHVSVHLRCKLPIIPLITFWKSPAPMIRPKLVLYSIRAMPWRQILNSFNSFRICSKNAFDTQISLQLQNVA